RSSPAVRIRGTRPSGAHVHHDSHGLRKFRRLLEAAVRRPRAGRDLPSEPRAGPACANRGSGRLGLPLGRAGWPALACGNGVGGAGRSVKAAGKRADFQPHLARCAHWRSDKVRKMTAFPSATRPSIHAIITLRSLALWPEHLLAFNLVVGDCVLALVRNEPVDELLAKLLLHMRMLGRVNQDDTVLVE